MATINNKLIHFKSKSDFLSRYTDTTDGGQTYGDFLGTSIVFIQDAKQIWTHGTDYYCGSGPVALKSDLADYATTSALTSGLAGKANTSHTHSISQISNLQNELDDKASSTHYHSANEIISGTISLDRLPSITDSKITSISADKITGIISQENLPSYVDDVLEYSNKSSFPNTGETGKIYIDTSTNLTYRWGGSTYVEIGQSLALGETSSTAYRGDRGKTAYDHSQTTGNPHGLALSDLGISATVTELNYMDGVTSNVQTQLDEKVTQSWIEDQGYLTSVSWSTISDKPSTFTPAAHVHSASDITSGTLSISRIPTGTSYSTVARGNHTHSEYALDSHVHGTNDVTTLTGYTEGSSTTTLSSSMDLNEALASLQNQIQARALVETLDDYALKTEIPDISNLATKTELAGYLPLTGGTLTGNLTMDNNSSIDFGSVSIAADDNGLFIDKDVTLDRGSLNRIYSIYGDTDLIISGNKGPVDYGTLTLKGGQSEVTLDQGGFKLNNDLILTEANWDDYITAIDTKNTTGTSNSTSMLYLVGGTSQSPDGVVTYSNSNVYTQSGQLFATRMNTTSGFYETSDRTLKDIKSELNVADNIDKIPTILFSWKKDKLEDGNKDVPVHIGTIAQDIQKIYPDLVAKDAEGRLTVDYARLSVIAIASIKELKKEIDTLKSLLIK